MPGPGAPPAPPDAAGEPLDAGAAAHKLLAAVLPLLADPRRHAGLLPAVEVLLPLALPSDVLVGRGSQAEEVRIATCVGIPLHASLQ
jgi:hypothetical protein